MTTALCPYPLPRGLASDNFAAVHPKVMERLLACNQGHAMAYGDDPITAEARRAFNRLFGQEVHTHFVFNGTAANNLALMAFARSFGSVLCSDVAHLCNDESTAPERFLGMHLQPIPSQHGKIAPEDLATLLSRGHGIHGARPVALTLTQPTELGTLYEVEELRVLADLAHTHGLGVHVDGARIGCAAAALGTSLREMILDSGIDALSFGGTKQGMLVGEAVIFLKPGMGEDFPYWQKHAMQLASKMRFLSAQFLGLLQEDLWIQNGRHANDMARLLLALLEGTPQLEVLHPVQANSVFARIPPDRIAPLQAESFFWPWDETKGDVRFMCAWDTQYEELSTFAAGLNRMLSL